MPTPIFACGAHCGTASGASILRRHWGVGAGTPTVETDADFGAGQAWEFDASAAQCLIFRDTAGSPTSLNITFRGKFTALPSGDAEIFMFRSNGGAATGAIRWDVTSGQFYSRVGSTDKSLRGPVIAQDDVFQIDLMLDISTTTTTLDWSINGTPNAQETQAGSASTFTTGSVRVGFGTLNATGTLRVSDIVVSATAGDFPMGAADVIGLRPNADGTHSFSANTDFLQNNTTNLDPSTTTAWQFIDDAALNETTDRITDAANSSAEYMEFGLSDPGRSDDAWGVEVVRSVENEATGTSSHTIQLVNGGSTADATTSANPGANTIAVTSDIMPTAPGGGAWTESVLNGLLARFLASDRTPAPSLHGVVLEVAYAEAVVGGGGGSITPHVNSYRRRRAA